MGVISKTVQLTVRTSMESGLGEDFKARVEVVPPASSKDPDILALRRGLNRSEPEPFEFSDHYCAAAIASYLNDSGEFVSFQLWNAEKFRMVPRRSIVSVVMEVVDQEVDDG